MLYNGVLRCHGHTCYVILIGAFFCRIHNICPINEYIDFEINRFKIDEFIKHARIVYFISFDAKTVRLPVQKLWRKQWFHVFGNLNLDLCSIF